jgi:hypothetical protein
MTTSASAGHADSDAESDSTFGTISAVDSDSRLLFVSMMTSASAGHTGSGAAWTALSGLIWDLLVVSWRDMGGTADSTPRSRSVVDFGSGSELGSIADATRTLRLSFLLVVGVRS